MKKLYKKFLFVLAVLLFVGTAHATDGGWEYVVIPYFLGAGMDGPVAVRGRDAEIDSSFSDILNHLEFGFMGHLEATNGKWIVLSDIFYAGLGAQPPNVDVDYNQWILEGGIGRKFGNNFEVLAGGRFNRVDAKLGFRGPLGIEVQSGQNWLDPYVGGRIIAPLSDRFAIYVRGDIGGFGIGSDFAWYLNPALDIHLTQKVSLVLFYRFDHVDYENKDDGFKFDVTISGPGAGIAFRF
jgi:hypothetical protein